MYCSNCGSQLPDGARFCRDCGAAQDQASDTAPTAVQTPDAAPTWVQAPDSAPTQVQAPPAPQASAPIPAQVPPPVASRPAVIHTPPPPPPPAAYQPYPPPTPPVQGGGTSGGSGSPRNLWIVIACVGIVVVALAIALPLIFLRGDTHAIETTSSSTTVVTAPPTTEATTESTEPTTEITEASTTTGTTPTAVIPGDSPGTWAETSISGLTQKVTEVAVSDDAFLFHTSADTGPGSMYAYVFRTGKTVQLPTSGDTIGQPDIYGTLAVWWEASGADPITAAHIYAYRLPDGPKVEVASGTGVSYPHVTNHLITWADGSPWATEPDSWTQYIIKAASVDEHGQPTGAATTLVDAGSAIAAIGGDTPWVYSLSDGFLAWEQQTESGAIPAGTYVMDLGEMQPWHVDANAWRPSLNKGTVIFTRNGVEMARFGSDKADTIDSSGDFATAAATYAAFFRPKASGDGTAWAVVARGYTGAYEQVLLDDAGQPPWLLSPIAASAHHIAFAFDGTLHLFTWQQ